MSRRHQPYTSYTRRGGGGGGSARCITTRTRPEVQYPSAAAPPHHDRRPRRRNSSYAIPITTDVPPPPPPPDPELVIRNRRAATTTRRRRRDDDDDDDDEYGIYVERRSRSRSRSSRRYGYGVPEVRSGWDGRGASRPAQTYADEMRPGDGDEEEGEGEVLEPAAAVLGYREAAGMRYGDFRLSKRSKEVFGVLAREPDGGEEEGEGEGSGKEEGVQAARRPEGERASEKRFRVLFSAWLENGSGGEDPVAELVVEPEVEAGVKMKWKGRGELFEWVHIKQDVMNFEAFVRRIEQARELSGEQKKWVTKSLKGISRQFEKPLLTQEGMHGRWMIPNFNQELRDGGTAPSVDFLCFPFFTLEKYGPPSLPENSRAHPKRTLLQTLFSSASKAQDYQQAVTKLPTTPKDFLFHVRQFWALIVDDSFMITCSSQDPSEMVRDAVNITSQPSFGTAGARSTKPKFIELSDGGMNIWLLPLERCRTWFLFTTNLYDATDVLENFKYFDIAYEGTGLSEEDWPKVIERAQRTNVRLTVQTSREPDIRAMPLRMLEGESDDDTETLVSEPLNELPSLPNLEATKGEFHIFTWLASSKNVDSLAAKENRLSTALEEIQKLLLRESHPKDRRAYKSIFMEAKRDRASYDSLRKALDELPTETKDAQDWRKYVTGFIKDAVGIFQFFLPLDCRAPLAACFWEALQRMVDLPIPQNRISHMPALNKIHSSLSDISQKVSGLEIPPPSPANPPDRFVVAWIHLSLAVCHWNPSNMAAFAHHVETAQDELDGALPVFLRSFQEMPLDARAAAMPLGVVSLITQELLMDFTGIRPDLITSYWDYYNQLNRRVDEDPLNRAHQKYINFLKQEIEAVSAVLNQQLNVLKDFSSALVQRRETANFFFNSAYAVEPTVVDNCIETLEAKINSFEDMRLAAANLQAANLQMIDSNKDRQEAAVYAFTIVTIIFLPLSFVSGFLGMNTADVRDMPHKQWVFWAAGVPLTILIILLGLLWAGELGNAWRGCLRVFDGSRAVGGNKGGGRARPSTYSGSVVDEPGHGGDEEGGIPRRRVKGGLVRRGTLASRR